MWRQFTQWLGGMGIIVLALAVLPAASSRRPPAPRVRAPGARDRPARLTGSGDTARRLWLLYVALTVLLFVLLAAIGFLARRGDDPVPGAGPRARDDADGRVLHGAELGRRLRRGRAVGDRHLHDRRRASTTPCSTAAFVRRTPRVMLRDEELRAYLALLAVGAVLDRRRDLERGVRRRRERAIRDGVFQSASIMTTTGFASVDFVGWPTLRADDARPPHVHRRLARARPAGRSRSSATSCSGSLSGESSARPSTRRRSIPIRLNAPTARRAHSAGRRRRSSSSTSGIFVLGAARDRRRRGLPGTAPRCDRRDRRVGDHGRKRRPGPRHRGPHRERSRATATSRPSR